MYVAALGDMLISFKAFESWLMSLQSCSNLGVKDIGKLCSQRNDNKCASVHNGLPINNTDDRLWLYDLPFSAQAIIMDITWCTIRRNKHVFSYVILSVGSKNENGNAMLVTQILCCSACFSFLWACLQRFLLLELLYTMSILQYKQ